MDLTLAELAELLEATLQLPDPSLASQPIRDLFVDTRHLIPPDSLYVALKGPHFDGHQFVEAAFQHGATAALVESAALSSHRFPLDRPLIVVHDCLAALQKIASAWRARFSIPLVAITGSNGKTIVKDMLAGILSRQFSVYRSPGSYNSQVGVALSLLGLRPDHQIAIIEAGISQRGEMDRLEEMIRPTAGIITNIGLAHAAGLGDLETTAGEKSRLFRRLSGPLILDADEPLLDPKTFHVTPKEFHVKLLPIRLFPSSPSLSPCDHAEFSPSPSFAIRDLQTLEEGYSFLLHCAGDPSSGTTPVSIPINLKIPGSHNVANAAMAAAMAHHLGASPEAISEALSAYSLREMRLEMHTTGAGITLINDAYNADPTSVRAALTVLQRYGEGHRQIAILGDMLDLGLHSQQAHHQIGLHLARHDDLHSLFCVGPLARHIGAGALEGGLPAEQIHFVDDHQDFEDLNRLLEETLRPGDVVLFKASRSVGLDRAAHRLLESVAPTRLFIDLEAIGENFHALRVHQGKDTPVMAVVKSFGYGNDATRISQTLIQEGVDRLAVAFPDEAIPLRQRGIKVPILVTNVRAAEADKFVKYDLDALIFTHPVAEALAHQATLRNRSVRIHLEVDTGMHRAGLRPHQVVPFARSLQQWPSLQLEGLMTHFAAADDPSEDEFTAHQIAIFQAVVTDLETLGLRPPLIHAANTAAAWRFPQARFDMVRVGLGLYGLHPSPEVEKKAATTRPALRFTTRVLHIHDIEPGETVGYARTWQADQPRRLATIAAGYNDGFPRFLSNRGEVLLAGSRCPIVGTICMDVSVVDITALPHVEVGDEVVLFGEQGEEFLHIDEWAQIGNTINYELLCNISPRVRRIFTR